MALIGFFNIVRPKFNEHSHMKDQAYPCTANMPVNNSANIDPVATYQPDIMTDDEHSHCKTCGDNLTNGEKDRGYCADCWSNMG